MAVNFAKLPELLRGPPPISGGELYGSAAPAGRTALRRQSDRRSAASIIGRGRSTPPPGLCEPGAHIGRR